MFSEDAVDLVHRNSSRAIFQACQVSGMTIFLHDYILLLHREIDLVWRQPLSKATLLYFITRYTLIPVLAVDIFLTSNTPHCNQWARFARGMELVSQTGVGVILLMRTYALCNQSRAILCVLAGLGLTILGFGIWARWDAHCRSGNIPTRYSSMNIAALLCSFSWLAFNGSIIVLTIRRFLQVRKDRQYMASGLFTLIVRNGCLFYGAITSLNIIDIAVYFVAPMQLNGIGIYFSRSISVVIISRFMLDMRDTFEKPITSLTTILRESPSDISDDAEPMFLASEREAETQRSGREVV